MPETFVPMRAWLRPAPVLEEDPPQPQAPVASEEDVEDDAVVDATREAKRFRAALADALAHTLDLLVADIASDVLARELQLAPCDVQRIADRALERYGSEAIAIRVHPSEAALIGGGWRIECDPAMRCGDVELVVSSGTIDARLGVRLKRVLAEMPA